MLMKFHEAGWRIEDPTKGGGYYKVYCACEEQHKATIHLTPSNPKYVLNKTKWLQRQECYKQDQEGGA